MESVYLILCLVFFLTAFMYASVGHGGASGYLAIMALAGMPPDSMKSSALILNLAVSLISFIYFYKKGYFNQRLFFPFAITSIPFAYFGSSVYIDPFWYKKILAVCLAIAAIRIFGIIKIKERDGETKLPLSAALAAGSVIGLVSGMIGIGGGILLSPLILLFGWGKLKETACVSALFIFVNSAAGLLPLLPQLNSGNLLLPFLITAVAGGLVGGWWGSSKAKSTSLKLALGVVLILASVKLISF